MSSGKNLVLASNSPRRRQLLALAVQEFLVQPADVDECALPGETPGAYVLRLAVHKAETCAARSDPRDMILAADTTVAVDGAILGKPADAAEAVEMLRLLRGKIHEVHTGIAIHLDKRMLTDLCTTAVPMRNYSDAEIADYVASGDPLDKAGAYAIQHAGFHPVEALRGCFASVMGLPLCHLARMLRAAGMLLADDLPAACQATLEYSCPVSAAILRGEPVG